MPDHKTVTFDASTQCVVPKVPSGEMLDRAVAFALNVKIGGDYNWSAYMADLWERMLAAAPTPAAQSAGQEAVGVAGTMPGTDGFTMACFKAADVPVGTKLYAAPVNGGERTDHDRLVRELDVLLNGEHAASQASLCDIVSQVRAEGIRSLKGGERYAELEREHFGDPDKRTGIYAQRSADAQQVGDLELSLNEFAALQRQIGAEGYTEKLTNQSNALYRQLRAALTSPAKVGGDEREAFKTWKRTVPPCHAEELVFLRQGFSSGWELGRAALSADGGDRKVTRSRVLPGEQLLTFPLPEGGKVTLTWPEGISSASIATLSEMLVASALHYMAAEDAVIGPKFIAASTAKGDA
ncbi:hypothetical protein [Pandoraea sp. CB10b_02]|uniref:hypothetical protein n=1 Tax=Pandoraea sp. CB10b_02 TaxID=2014535 RepID=UPI00257A27BB|nr:hypothetical protein [Pandoraea sp. CB10b_02]